MNKEKRQLLNSWTLELANWLITEHSMKRSEAFRKAHLKKANGEERQARGTLCHGISDDFDHYEYKAEDGDTFANVLRRGVYVYFDLDCRSFRSFAARNLISVDV